MPPPRRSQPQGLEMSLSQPIGPTVQLNHSLRPGGASLTGPALPAWRGPLSPLQVQARPQSSRSLTVCTSRGSCPSDPRHPQPDCDVGPRHQLRLRHPLTCAPPPQCLATSRGGTTPAPDPQPVTAPPGRRSRTGQRRPISPVSQAPTPPVPGPRPQEHRRGPGGSHSQPATQPQASPRCCPSHSDPGAPSSYPGAPAARGASAGYGIRRPPCWQQRPDNAPNSNSVGTCHPGRPPDRILVVRLSGSVVARWLCCPPRSHPASAYHQDARTSGPGTTVALGG
ncbi:hypothetical protein NDU88_004953 [Pleurodeles waltl]|uniref:Uncharacterized protein n=1 Tax=Pleurodeles waltl TaxID=8319 RepID=A0AAV7N2Y0_PLEWA|nr:hypothetical protein NDU88_004953 [Pleurodeles waltl]